MSKKPKPEYDHIPFGCLDPETGSQLYPEQREQLVEQQWRIYQAELKVAKQNEEEAERARERAAKATAPVERQRYEKQAAIYTSRPKGTGGTLRLRPPR